MVKKILSTIGFLIIAGFAYPLSVFATGITPSEIYIDNILPNTEIKKIVTFTRGTITSDEKFSVTFSQEAAEYITPLDGKEITFKKGEHAFPYHFSLKIPQLAQGTYVSKVRVSQLQSTKKRPRLKNIGQKATNEKTDTANSGSSIRSGAEGTIYITVTNEAHDEWEVKQTRIPPTEENQTIGISFLIRNLGNVDTKPSKIAMHLKNTFNAKEVYDEVIDLVDFKPVAAFSERIDSATSKIKLTTGSYGADIVFYNKSGDVVHTSETLYFDVVPEGSLKQKGEFTTFLLDKQQGAYELGEYIKTIASFKNTGTIGTRPSLVLEIFKGDKRIDVVKSEPVFVPVNESFELEKELQIKEGGNYKVDASFMYGISKTPSKSITVTVGSTFNNMQMLLIISGIGTLTIVSVFIFLRVRRRKIIATEPILNNVPEQK